MHLGPKIFGVHLGYFSACGLQSHGKVSACVICLPFGSQNKTFLFCGWSVRLGAKDDHDKAFE